MNYKSRILAAKLHKMIQNFAVVIVRGSRQVGKSTLLQYELPHWDTVVFDPAMDIGNARRDPDLFLSNHPPPLILDEIQYAPEMLGALKRRVDKARDARKTTGATAHQDTGLYVLTGSLQWAVLKAAGE
ncbi:MAG: AAA family ATPase [Planctomycetia bacterium]|nr:AAA family ATPase [Planctomycetia bacterium]